MSIRENSAKQAAKSIADDALRGLRRERSAGFRATFLRGVREVDIVSHAGIYIGRGGSYYVDLQRLNAVAKRIVRGLFLHHYKKCLPFGDSVEVWAVDGFGESDVETVLQIQEWVGLLKRGDPNEVGSGVFKYWHRLADASSDGSTDEFASLWLLTFYEASHFFGITLGNCPNKAISHVPAAPVVAKPRRS